MHIDLPFILASQSPRRRRLLERLGLEFTVRVSPAEEVIPPDADPASLVDTLAREKAAPVANAHPDALVLAADTVVALDGVILGKPASRTEAATMLQRLSGTTHTVYTGIALVHRRTDRTVTAVEATEVTFGVLDAEEIAAYVATGSPMDKAGSYGIQDDLGALFVERITGDYYNVVGLPLRRLYRLLRAQFPEAFSF
ncbi:MAG: septum formation inhibitor Maf [Bacteroidetes bacterium]|nr:septum formation inhibitor Maf [Bacteroidota bacterium]